MMIPARPLAQRVEMLLRLSDVSSFRLVRKHFSNWPVLPRWWSPFANPEKKHVPLRNRQFSTWGPAGVTDPLVPKPWNGIDPIGAPNARKLCGDIQQRKFSAVTSGNHQSSLRLAANLPKTMRAAVMEEVQGRIHTQELDLPVPKPGEVLVKNTAVGVCFTDLHAMEGHIKFPFPAVFGHEMSGTIVGMNVASEEEARHLSLNDKVIGTFIMPCGNCHFCENQQEDICEVFFKHNRLGGTLYDGTTRLYRAGNSFLTGNAGSLEECHEVDTDANHISDTHDAENAIRIGKKEKVHMYSMAGFAEYSVIPITAVYKLPEKLQQSSQKLQESAIIGCSLFTAYGAVRNAADLRAGANVVVIGCGGVGMNVLQTCKAFGANRIIAVDIDDSKLKMARDVMGATHTINAQDCSADGESVEQKIRELTNNRGADVAFEVLGNPRTFKQAVMGLRDGGQAVMVGIASLGTMAEVEITHLVRRKIRIHGSYGAKARQDTPAILDLLDNDKLHLEAITKKYELDTVGQAYDDLKHGKIVGKAIVVL